jgi:MtN3 and saliva related transmembrane protein
MIAAQHTAGPLLEAVGTLAATCTTISFLPQLIRVWQRKSASDISLSMFLLFNLGLACWLLYGIGLHSLPMIVANVITLTLALTILALKVYYDKGTRERGDEGTRE